MKKFLAMLLCCLLACGAASADTLHIYDESYPHTFNLRTRLYLFDQECFWGEESVNLHRDELVPVYAYPSEDGWRGANGRAAVSLNAPFTALAWSEDGQWLLIDYETDKGHRVGYIRRTDDMQIPVPTLYPLHIPLTVTKDFSLTDDPNGVQKTIAFVEEGDTLDVLGYAGYAYAYVETIIDGKPARAFLPLSVLATPEEAELPDVMAQLEGTWRFIGGAELLGDGTVIDGTGQLHMCATDDYTVFPPERLFLGDAPVEYSVYANLLGEIRYPSCPYVLEVRYASGSLERFGMQLTLDENGQCSKFGLIITGGGGGGYERADHITPLPYDADMFE